MLIVFDLPHLYYLPQYIPVYRELLAQGANCCFCISDAAADTSLQRILDKTGLPYQRIDKHTTALTHYSHLNADWIVFGNGFADANKLPANTRTALIYHASGMGFKTASIAPDMADIQVRFIAGEERLPLLKQHFPNTIMPVVGFAKLDPLFDGSAAEEFDWAARGLQKDRPTLLYAPTFYPSSIENFPNDWPADFKHCNILIKPHEFTLTKSQYRAQRQRLSAWQTQPNVHVCGTEDYSLVPLMAVADLMISDKSSAIFEFAALDKPIVVCDFVKHRWSYRGLFKWRLRQRLLSNQQRFDAIATHVTSYEELRSAVADQQQNPTQQSAARQSYSARIMGVCDGQAAKRIADYLLHNAHKQSS